MNPGVIIRPQAKAETRHAYETYRAVSPRLGERFRDAVRERIHGIAEHGNLRCAGRRGRWAAPSSVTRRVVQSSESVVLDFIARINEHDVAGVVVLCSAEHHFVDSLGRLTVGLDRLREAWSGYFALFPDYRIEVELLLTAGDSVLLAGWASATAWLGTPKQQRWRIPAAWRATTRVDLLDLWQVYADNKPVYDLLARDV